MEGNKKNENIADAPDKTRILCLEAQTAYHTGDLDKANRLCNNLQDLIRRQKRNPNKREQDLINTLKAAIQINTEVLPQCLQLIHSNISL